METLERVETKREIRHKKRDFKIDLDVKSLCRAKETEKRERQIDRQKERERERERERRRESKREREKSKEENIESASPPWPQLILNQVNFKF